jgi:apolipoprotein D and lipocalin family protein
MTSAPVVASNHQMRKASKAALLVAGIAAPIALLRAARSEGPPPAVEPNVDLARYAGRWYEIARLPNWFERNCTGEITATYTLRSDGRIDVLNQCGSKSARAVARPASRHGPNTKLEVTFFWPFSGDYWILALDPDYRWALIGEPRRKYLWILARDRQLDPAVYESILSHARGQGYDLSRLIRNRP